MVSVMNEGDGLGWGRKGKGKKYGKEEGKSSGTIYSEKGEGSKGCSHFLACIQVGEGKGSMHSFSPPTLPLIPRSPLVSAGKGARANVSLLLRRAGVVLLAQMSQVVPPLLHG